MNPTEEIARIDTSLSVLRSEWMSAEPANKTTMMKAIECLLDKRLDWMQVRDAAKST